MDEKVDGMLVSNEKDNHSLLENTIHGISSPSIQAWVNFADTDNVKYRKFSRLRFPIVVT